MSYVSRGIDSKATSCFSAAASEATLRFWRLCSSRVGVPLGAGVLLLGGRQANRHRSAQPCFSHSQACCKQLAAQLSSPFFC